MKAIFIGACPRSGTTFLGGLLGKHSNIFFPPELNFKLPLLREAAQGSLNFERAKQIIENHPKSKALNFKLYSENEHIKALTNYDLAREVIINVLRGYQLKDNAGGKAEDFFVDHTPSNFWIADDLLKAFPEAKFIHIVRDGRAVFSSVKELTWGPNIPTHAAQWWMAQLAFGLALETRKNFPIVRVKYEDAVTDTTTAVQKLMNFIEEDFAGINWDAATEVSSYTKQQHSLVGKQPEKNKIDEWKAKLSKREIELFEYASLGLLETLGYKHYFKHPYKKMSAIEHFRYGLRDKILKYTNKKKQKDRLKKN